ncbi:MAG: TRAP transporter TatT component family protein [Calditrichota bacterium]
MTVWAARPLVEEAYRAILSETDPDLARTALEANLKLLDALVELRPRDVELKLYQVQAYTGYAMMFLEPGELDRARRFYHRASDLGFEELLLRVGGTSTPELNWKEFQRLIVEFRSKDLGLIYWTAIAWAGWINLERDNPVAAAESPRPLAMMEWVIHRNAGYFYSGPLWFMGTYYASLPPLLGGDLERSREFFESALKQDGNHFLWGRLLFAQTYAVQALDRDLFETQLKLIIQGSVEEPPELKLLNRIAQIRARVLLNQADDIF